MEISDLCEKFASICTTYGDGCPFNTLDERENCPFSNNDKDWKGCLQITKRDWESFFSNINSNSIKVAKSLQSHAEFLKNSLELPASEEKLRELLVFTAGYLEGISTNLVLQFQMQQKKEND